jgi:hypothetical protein
LYDPHGPGFGLVIFATMMAVPVMSPGASLREGLF